MTYVARAKVMTLFDDTAENLRGRVFAIYAILAAFNVGAWLWAILVFRHYPVLLGTALLAYSFGLRHAVDADHIAAIDNVTRKLMQSGKRPVAVGFMFSLGHSTVVVLGSAAIAGTALALQHRIDVVRDIGGVIGTWCRPFSCLPSPWLISSFCDLFAEPSRAFARGEPYVEEDFDLLLNSAAFFRGCFARCSESITRSWHMYPLGLLFGLGFDTATEIGLLGISAAEASKGLPFGAILVFPALFAAGMSLIDTTDNILMLGAYGWAFVKPIRKLYYNLTITSVSVMVAMVVGGVEALGLLAGHFHLKGIFWGGISKLNSNFGALGYCIVGLFAVSWIVSIAVYRWRRLDDFELNTVEVNSNEVC